MSLEAIKTLPVAKVAAKDCILFLWSPAPLLPEALEVLKAWGFQYKTCAVWVKDSIGPGHWFRQQHELLLLGTKGDIPVPEPENRPSSLIRGSRGHTLKSLRGCTTSSKRRFPSLRN
jgi:N6-adenosine-specific RNA methylase IME4